MYTPFMIAVATVFKGVLTGLILVGLALAVACTGSDDAAESDTEVTVEAGDPGEVEDPESEEVAGGFSQESIDYLLELLEADASEYGMAGGCIWPEGSNDNNTLYPRDLLGWEGWVASATWDSSPGVHVATVYRPDYDGETVTEFAKVEGPGYLCYESDLDS